MSEYNYYQYLAASREVGVASEAKEKIFADIKKHIDALPFQADENEIAKLQECVSEVLDDAFHAALKQSREIIEDYETAEADAYRAQVRSDYYGRVI